MPLARHLKEDKLSGDQKTEKNSTFAILSKADESLPDERLAFVTPIHEYFHQTMCMMDISSELFRDCTRGLDGGAFFYSKPVK